MSSLMDIAHSTLSARALDALMGPNLFDLLYADDTMILGSSPALVEELASAIEGAGA